MEKLHGQHKKRKRKGQFKSNYELRSKSKE